MFILFDFFLYIFFHILFGIFSFSHFVWGQLYHFGGKVIKANYFVLSSLKNSQYNGKIQLLLHCFPSFWCVPTAPQKISRIDFLHILYHQTGATSFTCMNTSLYCKISLHRVFDEPNSTTR